MLRIRRPYWNSALVNDEMMRYNGHAVDAGRYMPRLTHRKVVKPMVEMFVVVFAAMTFVVALITLTVFIVDVIDRKKK